MSEKTMPGNGSADWVRRDLAHVWHPCTQMQDHEQMPPIPIARAEGVWLEDMDGKRYLDAISSWWVNVFGHANARISGALKQQLDQLEHVIMAGFTHQPLIELAENLVRLAPPGLTRCQFADSGAAATEIALKMSLHYWRNQGRPEKNRFISLENGYHGETVGALAVTDIPLFSSTYEPLIRGSIRVPSPDCYLREAGESWEACSRRQFSQMEKALEQHHDSVCAVIIEPLVQGAAGMRMYHPVYLSLLREACTRYGVHLIADEIAVGFGRTGTVFACEQGGITPDFLCLSKALTGGYLAMSVVMTTEEVYAAFYAAYDTLKGFLHSHSYTGNALAACAAREVTRIFLEEPVIERNREIAAYMAQAAAVFADHPHIAEVRQTGMIVAMELVQDKTTRKPFDWKQRRGLRAYQHALSRGVLLRPLGNVVYWMPPYVISHEEIDLLAQVTAEAIDVAVK